MPFIDILRRNPVWSQVDVVDGRYFTGVVFKRDEGFEAIAYSHAGDTQVVSSRRFEATRNAAKLAAIQAMDDVRLLVHSMKQQEKEEVTASE